MIIYLAGWGKKTDPYFTSFKNTCIFTDSESLLNCMTLFEMKETNLLTYFTKLTSK